MKRRIKIAVFKSILFLPLAILLVLLSIFFKDVYTLNTVDYNLIEEDLEDYCQRERPLFPPPASYLELDHSDNAVYVFGASSVLLSDRLTFAKLLDQRLKTFDSKIKVINFGVLGIESGSIKHRMVQALTAKPLKPKLIILYYGHNDYNNPYTEIINQHFDSFGSFLKVAFLLSNRKFNFPNQSFIFNRDHYPIFHCYKILGLD